MPKACTKSTGGFSLIEIIITIAFVAIIVSIFLTAANTWRSIRGIQWQTYAYDVAKHEMENLRNTPFANLPSSGSFTDSQLSRLPSGSGQLIVTGSDPKNVKIVVSWVQNGLTKNYVLETLFTAR